MLFGNSYRRAVDLRVIQFGDENSAEPIFVIPSLQNAGSIKIRSDGPPVARDSETSTSLNCRLTSFVVDMLTVRFRWRNLVQK